MSEKKKEKPKKYLGQHFLHDKNIISRIIHVADISKDDLVVEIGPGEGALTFPLAEKAGEVIAIEIDKQLVDQLREKGARYNNLTIIEGDALKFHYEDINRRFKVVSNLPYYISTPIIFRLMELRNQVISMTLMLQKEVAQRIVAVPDSKDYGVLSIAVQFYAEPSIAFYISKGSFYPSPEVDSAIVKIVPRKEPVVKVKNENLFWSTIKTAFSYRRKTILNSLAMCGLKKEYIEGALKRAGIDPSLRPEDLSIEQWGKLVDGLISFASGQKMWGKMKPMF